MLEVNETSLRLELLRLAVKAYEIHADNSASIIEIAEQFYEFIKDGEEL